MHTIIANQCLLLHGWWQSIDIIPYSGYNLQCTIFAKHQISHLAVIFGILNFVNHCMYHVTFCVARSAYAPVAYQYFNYKRQL